MIGVELVQELNDIARQNIARTTRRQRCRDIELVCADLREYPLPDDVTVIFINNAIRGPIFRTVLDGISASLGRNPRRVRLFYCNPVEDAAVLATGAWRKVRTFTPRGTQWPFGATCVYESAAGRTTEP